MPTQDWTGADDFDTEEDNSGFVHDALADHKTLADGLRAYYPLDTGSGTTATDEAFNNDGTINGATWVSGQIGDHALSFDGVDDEVDCGFIFEPSEYTFSSWVNVSSFNGTIVNLLNTGTESVISFRTNASDQFQINQKNSAGTNNTITSSVKSTNTWYHAVGSWDGDTLRLYVDGAEVASTAVSSLKSGSDAWWVGSGGGFSYHTGELDDVRIYNRALSADEVTELYNKTEPTQIPEDSGRNKLQRGYEVGSLTDGLAAYYPMENSGSSIVRDGALGNDGEINGALWNGGGQVGNDCLSFDGTDDYVNVNGMDRSGTEITISGWIKSNSTTESRPLTFRREVPDALIILNSGGVEDDVRFYTTAATDNGDLTVSGYDTGTWTHYALTATENGSMEAYINGVKVGSDSVGTFDTLAANDAIGIGRDLTSNPHNGLIDDVRIYDRVLSEPEIKALYSQTVPDGKEVTDSDVPNDTDGGVSRYPFDGDVLDSWGTNDGTDNTSAGYGTGVYGQGKSFDGTDDYVVSSAPVLPTDTSKPFSISTWLYHTGGLSETPISRRDPSTDEGIRVNINSNGDLAFRLADGTNGNSSAWSWSYDNEWVHVVAIYDGSNNGDGMSMYINGRKDARTTSGLSNTLNSTYGDGKNLRIGSEVGQQYWGGDIDDVRIYDRVLDPTEVEQLFELGSHRIARSDTI